MARRIWIVCLSLACVGVALPSLAQDGLLEDLYGRGVHAYFEHRYEEAHGLLTKAITSGLKDPRAYYFRGLTNLRLGRSDEAQAEFATGAEYEAMAAEPVNVGKALERIQGAERMAIERHRRAGRLALHNKAAAAAKARYEERIRAEERVLLPGRGGASTRPAPAAADESDPFKEGAVKPEPLPATPVEPKPVPATDAPPVEPKPAAAPAGTEPKPATTDPFAEEPKPGTPKPAEPKPAEPAAGAEKPRGSVLGSLFRAATAGAAKGLAGDDASKASTKPAPAPAAVPEAADPFADPK
jgi:tetratricopeptide (TPR) repeat protein